MTITSQAENRVSVAGTPAGAAMAVGGPPARPSLPAGLAKPKAPVAAARQKPVAKPAAGRKPAKAAGKRRNWPILEVALILVLVKIAAGAFYIWNRQGGTGWDPLSAFRNIRQTRLEYAGGTTETPEAAMFEALASPETVVSDQTEAAMLEALGLPEVTVAGQPETLLEKPAEAGMDSAPKDAALGPPKTAAAGRAETVLAEYLAAALKATQPAPAQAAPAYAAPGPAAPASAVLGALTAGALMVVGGQNASGLAGENIPLPPGEEALWRPAAQLPAADLPSIGTGGAAQAPAAAGAGDFESLRKLREREQELARREAILSSRTGALGALELELNQRLKETETVKKETEGLLQRNEAVLAEQQALAEQQKKEDEALKDVRLKHLVTAYTGMKPEQAGSLMNSMDDDVAVSILSAMPGGKAGKILAMVNPEKAARLTKAISEKRIDPNMLLNDEEEAPQTGAPPPAGP